MHEERQFVTAVFRLGLAAVIGIALHKLQTGAEAASFSCKSAIPYRCLQSINSNESGNNHSRPRLMIQARGAPMSEHVRELSAERPEITSGFCRPSAAW
jgi:hypothetical protein